nr:class I SAM-dependent rRNA methyltransferase [Listeria floridensis]
MFLNEVTLKINKQHLKAYQNGYPLILRDNLETWRDDLHEGDLIRLVDSGGRFVAKGYYGLQNKGIGWIFTTEEQVNLDGSLFKRLIHKALEKRQSLFNDESTTAFRLFNGEGDGLGGITVDYYDGYLLFQWYSIGIYHYQKEFTRTWFDLPFVKGIYEKKRFETTEQASDFVGGTEAPLPLIVKENGINYATYLNDGWMTGIFLDQRDVRKRIMDHYASGKTVLNTFSYTGAFSVAALYGGALQTTSVDVAKRSRKKTAEQFEVNGIDPEAQAIVVEDVFQYFKYAKRKGLSFDLVITDPPSFARTKKITFRVAKDYPELLREVIAITARHGVIVASTNYAGFSLSKFTELVEKAFNGTGRSFAIRETYRLPHDFQVNKSFNEGNYLKVLFLELDI